VRFATGCAIVFLVAMVYFIFLASAEVEDEKESVEYRRVMARMTGAWFVALLTGWVMAVAILVSALS